MFCECLKSYMQGKQGEGCGPTVREGAGPHGQQHELAADGRRGAHGGLTGCNSLNVAAVGESHLLNTQFGMLAGQKSIHLC